jgi:hypothetical protein
MVEHVLSMHEAWIPSPAKESKGRKEKQNKRGEQRKGGREGVSREGGTLVSQSMMALVVPLPGWVTSLPRGSLHGSPRNSFRLTIQAEIHVGFCHT